MDRRRSGSTAALSALFFLCVACLGEPRGNGCTCSPEGAAAEARTAHATASDAAAPEASQSAPAAEAVALPDFSDPSWTRVTSRAGTYLVCWRSTSGRVPRNEDFTLEAWVLRDGKPVSDAVLSVSGWMPDHGHGMLRKPTIARQDDGSFHVEGMLLHMRGHWQLLFEVLEGNLSEAAECALDL